MKSFNEKDLITWYNREKAVIGNEYYFADDLDSMECKIKKAEVGRLIGINDNEVTTPFENSGNSYLYACILPVYDKKNNSILIHKVCIDYTTGTIKWKFVLKIFH